MAFHTKKQFAELCGITTKILSTNQGRGKVIYSGDFVDDSIEPNISFLKKYKELKGSVSNTQKEPDKVEKPKPSKTKPNIQEPETHRPPPPDVYTPSDKTYSADGSLIALEKEKLSLQNKKLNEEIGILKKRNEKIAEESVLVEHVRALIIIQSESGKIAWENATEDLIVTMKREFQLTNEQIAKIRSEQNDIVNNALMRAAEESRKSLKRLQVDYTHKRGKGERK